MAREKARGDLFSRIHKKRRGLPPLLLFFVLPRCASESPVTLLWTAGLVSASVADLNWEVIVSLDTNRPRWKNVKVLHNLQGTNVISASRLCHEMRQLQLCTDF